MPIGDLIVGTEVSVIAQQNGWYQVLGFDTTDPDRFGWVAGTMLDLDSSAACQSQNITTCNLNQAAAAAAMTMTTAVVDPGDDLSGIVCQVVEIPLWDVPIEINLNQYADVLGTLMGLYTEIDLGDIDFSSFANAGEILNEGLYVQSNVLTFLSPAIAQCANDT